MTTIATTTSRSGSKYNSLQASVRQRAWKGLEFLASYTFAKGTTNNRGFYGVFGGTGPQGVVSATEGAYWQNTYDPEAEWGPMFHDVRHNFVFSCDLRPAVGQGPDLGVATGRGRRTRSSADGRSAGSSRPAPACPSPSPTAATARCRASAARSGPTASATRTPPTSPSTTGWTSPPSRRPRWARSATARTGVARGPGYWNLDLMLSQGASRSAATAASSSAWRRSTPSTTRASGRRSGTSRRRTRSGRSPTR